MTTEGLFHIAKKAKVWEQQQQKSDLLMWFNGGTQRPNASKYARRVSDGFLYTLEPCLVNLEVL